MRALIASLLAKKNGILSLSSTHVINIGVAVLTLPIILINIPISEYGQWQFMLALQSWAGVISAQQITGGSKRGLALGQDGTFFFALFKRGKLLLLSSLLFFLLALYFYQTDRATLASLSGLGAVYLFSNILIQTSIGEYFIAKKQFFVWGIWDILSSPIARIGSSVVAFLTHSVIFFVVFQIIFAGSISLIALSLLISKHGLWRQFRQKNYDISCVKYGLRFFPIDLLGVISNRLVEVLIGVFFGFSSLAFFSVARDLRNQVANILKISSPLLYGDFVRQPIEKLTETIRKRIPQMIATSTALAFIGVGLGVAYIFYFLPNPFQASLPLFVILSLAFPIGIPTILLHTILDSHLRYRAIAAATVIPNIIEIILIVLLGWIWGIIGMTTAIAIFGFISFLFYYLATVKRETFKAFLERNRLLQSISKIY